MPSVQGFPSSKELCAAGLDALVDEQAARRQVALLAVLFAVAGTGATIVVTVSALVGLELAGRPGLATLPIALGLLGGMVATLPASHLMARWGRRVGFQLFVAIGLAGALLAVAGILRGSFALFCAGSIGIGAMTGASQFFRFAAAEVAGPERRERAISYVLVGGVVAGLAGPPLAKAAAGSISAARFAGSYLALAVLAATTLLLLFFVRVPRPAVVDRTGGRPLAAIARDPRAAAAVIAATVAFGAMVLTMVAAPLSLKHGGHPLSATAYVIQAHVVAMYLPSFVSGSLVERVGTGKGMAIGLAALAACVAVNLQGASVANHYVALVLLGIGWNLLFVSGTALLTRTHTDAEKAKVQGTNDLLVSATAAGAAFLASPLHERLGWDGLNLAVGGLLVAAALSLPMLLGRSKQTVPAGPASS